MDLLQDIIDYLILKNLAVAKDQDIFKDYSPTSPDNCIIVYEYNGSSLADFENLSVRSVQIVVRSKSIVQAKALSWSILKVLQSESNMLLIGARNCIIDNRSTPIKIGVDELDRNLVGFNLGITTYSD